MNNRLMVSSSCAAICSSSFLRSSLTSFMTSSESLPACDHSRAERQLVGDPVKALDHRVLRQPADLEEDRSGLDHRAPEFRFAFARAHADFERLGADRLHRKDADEQLPFAAHVLAASDAGRFDVRRRKPCGFESLKAEVAEG